MKIQFPEKLIIAHLSINSVWSKFDSLSFMIEDNADMRICQFSMLCRYDSMSGGRLFYITDEIPSKLLKHDFGTNIETLSVETNLQKRKWFFNSSDIQHKSKIFNYLNYLNLVCSKDSKVYDNFIFMGDFNVAMSDKTMEDFCSLSNLETLIKITTFYKSHENLTCIDLIFTSRSAISKNSNVFKTGISDFYLLVATQLKWVFKKSYQKL